MRKSLYLYQIGEAMVLPQSIRITNRRASHLYAYVRPLILRWFLSQARYSIIYIYYPTLTRNILTRF